MRKNILTLIVVACSQLFHSHWAFAQVILGPGQSQTITCSSSGGGGGGSTTSCIRDLTDWCYSKTSYSRDTCYNKVSAFCPNVSYSSCVQEATQYCYDNTSSNYDRCFDSSLGTCRGSLKDIKEMMENVQEGAKLSERGVDVKSLKSESNKQK